MRTCDMKIKKTVHDCSRQAHPARKPAKMAGFWRLQWARAPILPTILPLWRDRGRMGRFLGGPSRIATFLATLCCEWPSRNGSRNECGIEGLLYPDINPDIVSG